MNLLEALRYLAALDQHRHFGRAAMACRITQPALSNAIRALETELGVPVVRRSRQYEGLTAEGEVVLAHAHRLLREAEAMRQELHSREEAPRGRLQIGAVPTAMTIATRFALRVRERHGGLAPVVRSLSSQEIEAGIENLSLDLGLGYTGRTEVGARAMQVWPQYAEAYYVVQRTPGSAGALSVGPPIGLARGGRAAADAAHARHAQPHHRRSGVPRGRRRGERDAGDQLGARAVDRAGGAATWPRCCPARWCARC